MSYNGFGSGMKTLSPDSSNSLKDFDNLWFLSGYRESDLHQQCLVLNILPPF